MSNETYQAAGEKLARLFFEKRGKGKNVEAHLSEAELAMLLAMAFELGAKSVKGEKP